MTKAKDGDRVKVHYTGRLKDGTEFDSSRERDPLEFEIGKGKLIRGFETGVTGMEPGQTKTVSIPPDKAYGQRRNDLIISVPRSSFPTNITPTVGQHLEMSRADGNTLKVVVADIEGENVKLDGNHPLAGKTLEFDIELVEIC